jgi:hypothetical protein
MGEEGEFDTFDYSTLDESTTGDVYSDSGPNFGSLGGAASWLPVVTGGGGATYTPTAGVMGAAAGAVTGAAVFLGSRLAAMMGRGAGSAVINGVKFSMSSLWPYIRRYGPGAVAGALGISLAQLGALAMSAPTTKRKRRRGISAADISRAKRVIRFNRRLSRSLGTSSRSRGFYRPRGRHAHYFN